MCGMLEGGGVLAKYMEEQLERWKRGAEVPGPWGEYLGRKTWSACHVLLRGRVS